MQITSSDICFKDAAELAGLIRDREVSATEVMTAFLSQIERVNPQVNAICTFIGEDAALALFESADRFVDGNRQADGRDDAAPEVLQPPGPVVRDARSVER